MTLAFPRTLQLEMIKQRFIELQVAKSRAGKRTTPFLRRLVAGTVDEVARLHYAEAYPTKCVQTSIAVQRLLGRLGIASRVWLGAFCAAEVFENPNVAGWGGFWGDDHHAWTTTEFYELVDLPVGEMTKHPRSARSDGIPMPPLWWDDISQWPPVLRYLPDRAVEPAFPDPADMEDLARFLERVDQSFDERLASGSVEAVRFGPMLHGADSMNELHNTGHPWLERASLFLNRGAVLPPWIQEREQELIAAHRAGQRAPTRLSHVTGEVRNG